jgi:hypothetical protein
MDLNKLAQLVDQMSIEHSYPGYDVRSTHLGMPDSVTKSPARLFAQALEHESVMVKLVALRWFYDRPGDAKRYQKTLLDLLASPDEWVRLETAKTISRIDKVDEQVAIAVSQLLADSNMEVRKHAAKALGKLGHKTPAIIENLQKASADSDREVRWKAEKALRLLGAYQ